MGLKSFLASLSLKVKIAVVCAAVAVTGTATAVIIANTSADNTYRVLKVFELSGSAVVSRQGAGDLDAYVGMNLESGDTLSVNSGSTLRISMDGDKYVLLDEGTVLELVAEGSPSDSRTSLNLKEGTILNELTTSLSANSSYEVSTPKATMAVRGTSFMVSVKKNEDGSYIIETDTFHGKVEAMLLGTDGKPTGESAMIPAGKRVTIKTEPNPDSGKPAEVDGLSFFVYETEPGVFVIVPEGDDPVTDIIYELIPEIIKQYALNSNDSGMMVLNTEIAQRLRGTNDDAVSEDTKAPESEPVETTVPVEESETTTTTTVPETTTVTTASETEVTEITIVTTVPVSETTTKKTTTTTARVTKKTTKKTTTTTAPVEETTTTTTTVPVTEATTTTTTVPVTEATTTTTTTPAWNDTTPVTTEEEPPVSETYTINYVLASDPSIVVATQGEANYGDSLDASLLPIAFDPDGDGTYDYYLLNQSQISGTVTGNSTIPVTYELYDNVYEVKIVGGSGGDQHFLKKSGDSVSLPASTASSPPEGYTFIGWGAITSGGYATDLKEGSTPVADSTTSENSLYYSSSLTIYTGSVTLSDLNNLNGYNSEGGDENFKFVPVYAKIVSVTFILDGNTYTATNAYDGDTIQQALAKTGITIPSGASVSVEYENGSSADLNYTIRDGDHIKVVIIDPPIVTG
ncbi:MAG: FecR domain-containing protein [Ruminiclostridium sp.]